MNRQEHLDWAKKRALEYCDRGDIKNAFSSLASDLNKHPDTAEHAGLQLCMMEMMSGLITTPAQMRRHIEGYK